MSLPAPDPDAVMAVYEKKTLDKWSYPRIVEWSRSQPWGPISQGTAWNWVKQGAAWWTAQQRLDPSAEYAMHRQTVDVLFERLVEAVDAGRIDEDTFFKHSVRLLAEHRAATGFAAQLAAPADGATVTDDQLAAVAEMTARRRAYRRKEIGA